MLVGWQEEGGIFTPQVFAELTGWFVFDLPPTGTREMSNVSFKSEKKEWEIKKKERNASQCSLLQLKAGRYQQQRVHLLMCSDSGSVGVGGGSAFTPNVSFRQSSQLTRKQETDDKEIHYFRAWLPLKVKKFPLDFV